MLVKSMRYECIVRMRAMAHDPEVFAAARQAIIQHELVSQRAAGVDCEALQRDIDATRALAGTPLRAFEKLNDLIAERLMLLQTALETVLDELHMYRDHACDRDADLRLGVQRGCSGKSPID